MVDQWLTYIGLPCQFDNNTICRKGWHLDAGSSPIDARLDCVFRTHRAVHSRASAGDRVNCS